MTEKQKGTLRVNLYFLLVDKNFFGSFIEEGNSDAVVTFNDRSKIFKGQPS